MGKGKLQKGTKHYQEGSKIAVRRSSRLKSLVLPQTNKGTVEHVNVVDLEKEEEGNNIFPGRETADANLFEAVNEERVEDQTISNNLRVKNKRIVEKEVLHSGKTESVPIENEENLVEEEAECIVKSTDELISKSCKQERRNKGSSAAFKYKSLYIESQKVIEDMIKKHYEMVKKLKYANGKIDAYEKMIVMLRGDKDAGGPSFTQGAPKLNSTAVVYDDRNARPKEKRTYKRKGRVHLS